MFRGAFEAIDRVGTFDDIVNGNDNGIIEVPYWDWSDRLGEVSQLLSKTETVVRGIVWPILRDELKVSHALISRDAFTISPLSPPVHAIPSFADCPRRIFMSATISDDSEIVRTFGANAENVKDPIAPSSIAGVAERMILVPDWMNSKGQDTPDDLVRAVIRYACAKDINSLILTPSFAAAEKWNGLAEIVAPKDVETIIGRMQKGDSVGAIILANRYDGIDLPGESCRILVLDGLPRGMSEYDAFRGTILLGSKINSTLAQRIEQGIGRAAWGASDYCVVILSGSNLTSWIGQIGSMEFLTASTRKQIEIGRTVTENISSKKSLIEVVSQCLERDEDWKRYHAEELSVAAQPVAPNALGIEIADLEFKAIEEIRNGGYSRAEATLQRAADMAPDDLIEGWLLQLRSRALDLDGQRAEAQKVQAAAFSRNRRLTRPTNKIPYQAKPLPSKQAKGVAQKLMTFISGNACLIDFSDRVSTLTPRASSNQFEEGIRALGEYLGFVSERPENDYGDGPDNLWRTAEDFDFVIESKSRKVDSSKPLTKGEHGQLLVSSQWFQKNYPEREHLRVSIHPNSFATNNANAGESKALTFTILNAIVSDIRSIIRGAEEVIANASRGGGLQKELEAYCGLELEKKGLTPQGISKRLKNFSLSS